MEEILEEQTEEEIAYKILCESHRTPMNYRTLINTIIEQQGTGNKDDAAIMTKIYTKINMDSRFKYVGDGLWGLSGWYPPKTKRGRASNKSTEAPTVDEVNEI